MTKVAEQKNELINVATLPNLHDAEVSPRELSSEYWTPEETEEYRVGVIIAFKEEHYEATDGETVMLPCVIMLAQNKDLTFSTIRNGSKRLVATIEAAVESGEVILGSTPVRITYIGKKKNKTNSFQSDRWSVKPLVY